MLNLLRPLILSILALTCFAQPSPKTKNIIFVMSDGLRWQDVFRGPDATLLPKRALPYPANRREDFLPFLWTVVAKSGQIYGNLDLNSTAYVTNGLNFSYPGYSEIFCGFPDPRINSNDKNLNPNVNILEWLNQKAPFQGKIAAFGAWDLFPYILNAQRSGLLVNAGFDSLTPLNSRIEFLNRLKKETGIWENEALDAPTFHTALEYFKTKKPRILYLSLGDTDEWAHDGKYHLYLHAAHRFDQYVKELWETAQSMPEYRGSTTLILAVDHGRGAGLAEWKGHGEKVPDSKYVWMAFLGPDTPPLGERSNIPAITQSQVAATLAALLGEDYASAVPKAGKPLSDVLAK